MSGITSSLQEFTSLKEEQRSLYLDISEFKAFFCHLLLIVIKVCSHSKLRLSVLDVCCETLKLCKFKQKRIVLFEKCESAAGMFLCNPDMKHWSRHKAMFF